MAEEFFSTDIIKQQRYSAQRQKNLDRNTERIKNTQDGICMVNIRVLMEQIT
jgi:hypothetical protein